MARTLVGIPTKERPEYVKRAVESVLAQSDQDFRLIVSDNRSADAVRQDLERWFQSLGDSRVKYVYQDEDRGEYGQGRFFMEQLRDEKYFVMLHDDDLMTREYLASGLAVLDSDAELTFFSSGQFLIDAQGQRLDRETERYAKFQARDAFAEGRMDNPLLALLRYGLFSISGAIFRTDMLRSNGIVDEDCNGLYPFEFNVFLRACENNSAAWYTPKRLIAYRWHDASMRQKDGSSFNRMMVETLIHILEKRKFEGEAEDWRRRLLAFNYRNHALICHVAGEFDKARVSFSRARKYRPLSPNIIAHQILVTLLPGYALRRWERRVNLEPTIPGLAGVRYL